MINIKDKLNRTNIAIKRTNGVDAEYITTKEFEADKTALNGQITAINNRITDLDKNIEVYFDKGYEQGVSNQKEKLESKTISLNGTYTKEDGWNKVIVNVSQPVVNKQPLNVTLKENGAYNYTPSSLNSAYSSVTVNVNVPTSEGGLNYDFTVLGYDAEMSKNANAAFDKKILDDIAYSKSLADKWDVDNPDLMIFNSDKKLVFVPYIDASNVENMSNFFYDCTSITTIPYTLETFRVTDMSYMFYYCTSLTSIPLLYTIAVTNMSNMFNGCQSLTSIPLLNTFGVTNMSYMFYDCNSLTSIPQLDTSDASDMSYMFSNCTSLTSIPPLDTSSATSMSGMFNGCTSLVTIPQLDTSNITDMSNMFNGCKSLTSIPLLDFGKVKYMNGFFGYSNITTLTDLGGFKNLKTSWFDNYGLVKCPNLTYQSVMNVINNLYDFRGNGDNSTTKTLKLHSNSMALLSNQDKAIATAKGWVLSV